MDGVSEDLIRWEVRKGADEHPFEPDWVHDAWTVTLWHDGRAMSVPYFMGRGHNGRPPHGADVLSSVLMDDDYADQDAWEVVEELGYNDLADVKRFVTVTHPRIVKQSERLRAMLGDLYAVLGEAGGDEEYVAEYVRDEPGGLPELRRIVYYTDADEHPGPVVGRWYPDRSNGGGAPAFVPEDGSPELYLFPQEVLSDEPAGGAS